MGIRGNWPAGLAGATAAVVAAFVTYSWAQAPAPVMASMTAPVANLDASASAAVEPTMLYVLGDEFSRGEAVGFDEKGEPLVATRPDWPSAVADELDWDLVSDTSAGSGYLSRGGAGTFAERIAAVDPGADVVIVAGGVHDLAEHSVGEISAAADDVVAGLLDAVPQAAVVLVSPLLGGGVGGEVDAGAAARLGESLGAIADRHGVAYVDLSFVASGGEAVDGSADRARLAAHLVTELRELDLAH